MLPPLPHSELFCFCCAKLAIVLTPDPPDTLLVFFAPLAAKRSSKSKAPGLGLLALLVVAAMVGTEEEEALGFIALKLLDCMPIDGRFAAVLLVFVYVGPAGMLWLVRSCGCCC